MVEEREQPKPDEEFHEETPQEFAEQPDREFNRVPPPGPESEDAGDEDAGGGSQGEDGDQ